MKTRRARIREAVCGITSDKSERKAERAARVLIARVKAGQMLDVRKIGYELTVAEACYAEETARAMLDAEGVSYL